MHWYPCIDVHTWISISVHGYSQLSSFQLKYGFIWFGRAFTIFNIHSIENRIPNQKSFWYSHLWLAQTKARAIYVYICVYPTRRRAAIPPPRLAVSINHESSSINLQLLKFYHWHWIVDRIWIDRYKFHHHHLQSSIIKYRLSIIKNQLSNVNLPSHSQI